MDDSQVAKWQDLVSRVGQPREVGGAEGGIKVSRLRPLGTIEPEGRESPNGRARVCASLDSLGWKAENRQTAIREAKRVGHRGTEGTEKAEGRRQRTDDRGQTTVGRGQRTVGSGQREAGRRRRRAARRGGEGAPVENCGPAGGVLSRWCRKAENRQSARRSLLVRYGGTSDPVWGNSDPHGASGAGRRSRRLPCGIP